MNHDKSTIINHSSAHYRGAIHLAALLTLLLYQPSLTICNVIKSTIINHLLLPQTSLLLHQAITSTITIHSQWSLAPSASSSFLQLAALAALRCEKSLGLRDPGAGRPRDAAQNGCGSHVSRGEDVAQGEPREGQGGTRGRGSAGRVLKFGLHQLNHWVVSEL